MGNHDDNVSWPDRPPRDVSTVTTTFEEAPSSDLQADLAWTIPAGVFVAVQLGDS